ncbi:unnamed protein product [Bodo saltans]|uniref:Uncharacterized protein n=1 Tax=Bodo saltans TaxID=75058 RepID=A0A0S4J477_BODSA|nr:unnamed protein product [Bodo saltans]|eukprot:CUG76794.1 unnamed protein product [Bodo saltans]
MPPKLTRPKAFLWAKGNGTLTPTARGIIYGMHLSGQTAGNIASMMNVARITVYDTIKSMDAELNGRTADENSSDSEPGETTVAARVEERREKIDELMLEKKEDGNFAMKTARDVRKRIRDSSGELISLRTIHSWSEITQDEIDNLVLSFPHRIQKMLDNEGRPCQLKRCYLAREEVQENEV